MTALERRYRRLLRAYPAGYRAGRAEEMVGTLLETAPPDRNWPSWREAGALLRGGLRARALENHRLPLRANLRLSILLGLAMTLSYETVSRGAFAVQFSVYAGRAGIELTVAVALTLAAIGVVWFAPRKIAVPALAAAAAAALFEPTDFRVIVAAQFVVLAAVVALGPQRPPRSWLWWVSVLPAWSLLALLGDAFPVVGAVTGLVLPAFAIAAVLWIVIDARVVLGLATVVATAAVLSYHAFGDARPVFLGIVVALTVPALLRLRRRPQPSG
jgi:hypothetical protein